MSEISYPQGSRRYGPGGGLYHVVVSSSQTGGALFQMDVREPPGGGPPLHLHTREDELFYILEGEMTFYVAGAVTRLGAGNSLFAPRGVSHCFKNCSQQPVRMLITVAPGDLGSFFDYGLPAEDGAAPADQILIERIVALAPRYGLEIQGPSPL